MAGRFLSPAYQNGNDNSAIRRVLQNNTHIAKNVTACIILQLFVFRSRKKQARCFPKLSKFKGIWEYSPVLSSFCTFVGIGIHCASYIHEQISIRNFIGRGEFFGEMQRLSFTFPNSHVRIDDARGSCNYLHWSRDRKVAVLEVQCRNLPRL